MTAAAAAAHLPPVEFARRLMFDPPSIAHHARRVEATELVVAINRVGVLLNQIAARLNAGGHAAPPDLAAALAAVVSALARLA